MSAQQASARFAHRAACTVFGVGAADEELFNMAALVRVRDGRYAGVAGRGAARRAFSWTSSSW